MRVNNENGTNVRRADGEIDRDMHSERNVVTIRGTTHSRRTKDLRVVHLTKKKKTKYNVE